METEPINRTALYDFSNQGFMVTGRAGPLGRMLAESASQSGACVIVCSPRGDLPLEHPGKSVLYLAADLSCEEDADSLFGMAMDRLPDLRVLICAPSLWPEDASCGLADIALADWNRALITQLNMAFLVSQRAVQEFLASGEGGRIVFVVPDQRQGTAGSAVHSTLLHALQALCRSIMKEYGRREITCNLALVPDIMSADADRLAQAAETILFLASPEASFVNGETLVVRDTRVPATILTGETQHAEG